MTSARFLTIAIGLVLFTALLVGTWNAGYELGTHRRGKRGSLLTSTGEVELECLLREQPKTPPAKSN